MSLQIYRQSAISRFSMVTQLGSSCPRGRSSRRLVLIGHALRRHRVLAAHTLLLLCLHVLLIRHLLLLFGSDVMLRHAGSTVPGHVCLRSGNLRVVDFFGRINVGLAVDTVLTALWWFGRVETCLR